MLSAKEELYIHVKEEDLLNYNHTVSHTAFKWLTVQMSALLILTVFIPLNAAAVQLNFQRFQCGVYSRAAFISKSLFFFQSLTTVMVNRLYIM